MGRRSGFSRCTCFSATRRPFHAGEVVTRLVHPSPGTTESYSIVLAVLRSRCMGGFGWLCFVGLPSSAVVRRQRRSTEHYPSSPNQPVDSKAKRAASSSERQPHCHVTLSTAYKMAAEIGIRFSIAGSFSSQHTESTTEVRGAMSIISYFF